MEYLFSLGGNDNSAVQTHGKYMQPPLQSSPLGSWSSVQIKNAAGPSVYDLLTTFHFCLLNSFKYFYFHCLESQPHQQSTSEECLVRLLNRGHCIPEGGTKLRVHSCHIHRAFGATHLAGRAPLPVSPWPRRALCSLTA